MSEVMSMEVFLSAGGVCLSVPPGCGLDQADALRIDRRTRQIAALRAGSELPLDLPALSLAHCQALIDAKRVPVGEFLTQGVKGAYWLTISAG